MDDNRVTYFAETDARNKRVKFGIKSIDRTKHVYVIGKTGMGKSTLLENMAVQDIQSGAGMAFIDPHGKTADLLLEYVPKERIRDVIHIAPFDTEFPISFNVLESVDPSKHHLVVGGLMSTFKKIWEDAWSARMEYILTNTLLALLEAPGTTLLGVNRMLSDKAYRNEIVSHIKDPSVKSFWVKEFANYTERMAAEAVPAIQNKVGQFTANPLIRNMIGQPESSFDFRKAMDQGKIIIINLSKGRIGDENMKLLGGLLVTKIYLAAMSRADMPDRVVKTLPHFYLFVDEFQNFANASFADILSEARKYKLNLTIAHQYVEQMEENVRAAVFGNVGTMIVFRVGATDAEALEKEFSPQFTMEDLVNIGQFQMYLKLMIDGLTSQPFSARSMGPIPQPEISYVKEIIAASREQFSRTRGEVEEVIAKFHEPTPPAAKKPLVAAASAAPAPAPRLSASQLIEKTPVAPKPAPAVAPAPAPAPIPKPAPVSQASSPMPKPVQSAPRPASSASAAPKPFPRPAAPIPPPDLLKGDADDGFTGLSSLKDLSKMAASPRSASDAPKTSSQSQISRPVSAAAPKPIPTPPSVAPVSLSSLQKERPMPRPDPKTPTAENVSQLKNALAAALAKNKPSAAPAISGSPAPVIGKPMPKIEAAPMPKAPVPVPPPQKMPQPAPAAQTQEIKEVPEEVLKKVLKIE